MVFRDLIAFLRDVLRQRAVTQTAQLPETNENAEKDTPMALAICLIRSLSAARRTLSPKRGYLPAQPYMATTLRNHEAGHQEGCAHAVYLRLPEAEQVLKSSCV